jgi:cobalt-zinc-cadmium resistance protein CzcA
VQRPLAAVVVGGMFIGPIILLVIVPALQTLLTGGEERSSPEMERGDAGETPV